MRWESFQKETKASFEAAGFWTYRIKDNVFYSKGKMKSGKTPADFIAVWKKSYLIECKATASKSIAFSQLAEHQNEALRDFDAKADCMRGYIAVNFYDSDNLRARNRCFVVPIDIWNFYKEEGKRKSLSLAQCESDQRIIELPRIKGSMFDASLLE